MTWLYVLLLLAGATLGGWLLLRILVRDRYHGLFSPYCDHKWSAWKDTHLFSYRDCSRCRGREVRSHDGEW